MNPDLRDILFLDIETVAGVGHFDQLNERLKVQWARKANFLRRDAGQTDADLFDQRAGIYAEFGKIVCVALGMFVETNPGQITFRIKTIYGHDELVLLEQVATTLRKLNVTTARLCAHNGKEFDFPYLCRRLLINDMTLPPILDLSGKKPWEVPHLDTLEMWKFGDHKHYTSLDLLAAIFDIPSSKSSMDGSQVNRVYHEEGNLDKIRDYCTEDVIVLAKLFMKMNRLGPADNMNIEYA